MSDDNIQAKLESALFGTPEPEPTPEPEQTELQLVPDAEEAEESEVQEEETSAKKLEDLDAEDSLAAMLGLSDDEIDVREDGQVVLKTSVDGEEVTLNVKEVLASYQATEFATKKAQEVVEQRQQLAQEIAATQQAAKDKLDQMQKVSSLMEKELLAEYNSHNWDQLRVEAPAEYNRLRDVYSQKAQRIKSLQTSLVEEENTQKEQTQQAQRQQFETYLAGESEKILAANPTWQNPQIREKEMTELRTFLNEGYGYTEEEINQIADSRLVRLIQDAYRNKAPAATVKSKKVVPAYQAPSGGRAKAAANARAVKARKAALRKTGSTDALTQVLLDKFS